MPCIQSGLNEMRKCNFGGRRFDKKVGPNCGGGDKEDGIRTQFFHFCGDKNGSFGLDEEFWVK